MKYSILSTINDVSELSSSQLKQTFAVASYDATATATEIIESMGNHAPNDEDYKQWLEVMKGFAEDAGIDISRRSTFMDLAHMMWDNDPVPPPYHMRTKLAKTLWTMAKLENDRSSIAKKFPNGERPHVAVTSTQVVPQQANSGPVDREEDEELNQPQTSSQVKEINDRAVDPLSTALTASKHEIDTRIRQYEHDGESAFEQTKLVDNPHPHNSLAWKAWNKGYRSKLMTHFNIKTPTPEPARSSGKRKR